MSKQNIKMVPNIACPSCGNLITIAHLCKNQKYTWYCNNKDCGNRYSFSVLSDTEIDIELTGENADYRTVLVEIKPQTESIFLEVEGFRNEHEYMRYYYEEHTCPSNVFRGCKEVSLGDWDDPHGLVEFVKVVRRIE